MYLMCFPLTDKLIVDNSGAVLIAPELWGVIRGLETFSQLIYYGDGHARINGTHIKDYPRFSFRGLMLDTARHYIPLKTIKRQMVRTVIASCYRRNVLLSHVYSYMHAFICLFKPPSIGFMCDAHIFILIHQCLYIG